MFKINFTSIPHPLTTSGEEMAGKIGEQINERLVGTMFNIEYRITGAHLDLDKKIDPNIPHVFESNQLESMLYSITEQDYPRLLDFETRRKGYI